MTTNAANAAHAQKETVMGRTSTDQGGRPRRPDRVRCTLLAKRSGLNPPCLLDGDAMEELNGPARGHGWRPVLAHLHAATTRAARAAPSQLGVGCVPPWVRTARSAGKLTATARPPSGRGRTARFDPWAAAMSATIARPRPSPLGLAVRSGAARWKGSSKRPT